MRNRTGIAVGIALALVLAAVLAPSAGADGRKHRKEQEESDLLRLQTFNVSGEFSGTLSGEIVLNGVRYQLGNNVQVYEIGNGLIPAGGVIDDRSVFVSGVRALGSEVIFSVIVLPAVAPSLDRDDPSSHISIRTKSPEDE